MARQRRLPDLNRSGGFVGMAGMACLLFVYIGSSGFLPWWTTLILVVSWLVLFAVGTRWFTPRPARVRVLPVIGLLLYAGLVALAAR